MRRCCLRSRDILKILAPAYLTKSVNNSRNDFAEQFQMEERTMKNPLDSLWGTVIAGLVLTVVLYVFANNFLLIGG